MKNIFIKALMGASLLMGTASCGDSFLETDYYQGIDLDTGLNSVANIGNALNGTYYTFIYYGFAGNYATIIGDVASDLTYHNGQTGHMTSLYRFSYIDTDSYLQSIWVYGYKVADNSARVIKAANTLLPEASEAEKAELLVYKAEAEALRAYSTFVMTNVFGHQIKVNGQDFSSALGAVVIDEPVQAYANVERSTVGESYSAILADLNAAIADFQAAGGDRGDINYFSEAAVYGLRARVNLYMENYTAAREDAAKAIQISGKNTIAYDAKSYKALYNGGSSNTESLFTLAIDSKTNWSANSCGSLFTTYGLSPNSYLLSLYGEDDCRRAIINWTNQAGTQQVQFGETSQPWYGGGKFSCFSSGNTAEATNYIINIPEMFLIQAEAYINEGNITEAKNALFVVAHRNPAIDSTDDLPATKDALFAFLKDERARELYQEGHRLWDLRRWNQTTNLEAYGYPELKYSYTNVTVGNLLFPVPSAEINTGFGVVQNPDWGSTRPQ